MTRRHSVRAGAAALLLVLTLAHPLAAGAAPDDLASRLAAAPPGTHLRLQRDNGDVAEGYLVDVAGRAVRLAETPGGPATTVWPLDDVVGARREVSAAGRGFHHGGAAGAVLGSLVGFGLMALVDGTQETEDDVTAADYAAGTVAVATLGTLAVGGLGALLASGDTAWAELPAAGMPAARHLELDAGWATADDPRGIGYDGLHLRAWLPHRLTAAIAAGPEASWSGLGGTLAADNGRTVTINDTWSLGLAARLALPGQGLRPFASIGLGWYGREETWLGISLGGGVQWRRADGGGPVAEVRWHGRSTGIDDVPGNNQITTALGWALPF